MAEQVVYFIKYKDELMEVLIDPEDYYLFGKYKFYIQKNPRNYYVNTHNPNKNEKPKILRLHNIITGWKFVDHINGNGLDNRKENLRQSNHQLNARNRTRLVENKNSKFKGVLKQNQTKKGGWIARIIINEKQIYLGTYKTEMEAAKAYNEGAIKYFGQHAYLNEVE